MSGLGSREAALERLSAGATEPFDILVVGGGITGAGIALDAASRGLRTALVERRDFASGTSSKSSKLVHGGLRYLEQREFGLMREAAQERDLLRTLAPQLVEPIPFVLPVSDRWSRARFGAGLWAYDALASFKNLAVHRYLGVAETEAAVPALPKNKVKGGFLFYDCRNDDSRLVMQVLLEAVRYGATVLNHASVEDISSGNGSDIVQCAVRALHEEVNVEVRARRVIVAAGVWADEVEQRTRTDAEPRLRPSKGIHLAFPPDKLPMGEAAAFIPDADGKRFLFVIPWVDSVIVGTTDTNYEGDIDHPYTDEQDRRYCLDALNAVFELDLGEEDVVGAWAGLRPLIAGRAGSTADLSRRHVIYDIAPGVVGITGGKLTTYRRMAKDAVDHVAEALGASTKSRTAWIRLGVANLAALGQAMERRAERLGLTKRQTQHLMRAYGDRALQVLDVAEDDRALAAPVVPGLSPIAAELVHAARTEMVVHLEDALARRTRLALTDSAAGAGPDSLGPATVARVLNWTPHRLAEEVAAYRTSIETERGLPLRERREQSPATESGGTT